MFRPVEPVLPLATDPMDLVLSRLIRRALAPLFCCCRTSRLLFRFLTMGSLLLSLLTDSGGGAIGADIGIGGGAGAIDAGD